MKTESYIYIYIYIYIEREREERLARCRIDLKLGYSPTSWVALIESMKTGLYGVNPIVSERSSVSSSTIKFQSIVFLFISL